MKVATLFPDDEIHDTADDWKGGTRTDPVPYNNGTLTSQAAAESVRLCVKSQAARVWGFIDSQGEHGATDKEIQAGLQLDGNSQRPRRVWLMRNGFVKPKGTPCEHAVRERSIVWVVAKRFELTNATSPDTTEGKES
jgi:hypothetical protein